MATRKTAKAAKKAGRTAARRKPGAARPRDALALLKADHEKVDDLFGKFEKARSASRKQALAKTICAELTVHARLEEAEFYPVLREAGDRKLGELLDEADVEHQSLEALVAQIEASGPDDELFDAKVTVLGEYVRHHVKEEEREIFPLARKTDLDLKALGAILSEERDVLVRSLA